MEEKVLTVKFNKGITYEIPARVIAEDRARYYADIDGYEEESQEFLNEVNYALDDQYTLFDWIENNMNWNDIEPYAEEVVNEDELDLNEEWENINYTLSL